MKRKLLFFCLAMLSVVGLSSFQTNDDPIMALLKKLEEFTKKYPVEKVYLHLDKPYYAAGDNIWFKAYVTDWKTGELTPMSTVLYVELINQNNNIEKKLILPMQNGLTWGDFKLADALSEGNYRIRAYTQWMRNAGPNFFFDKTIKIGNGWTNKVFTKTQFSPFKKDSIRASIDVQFLPEGGTLLEGVKSKIAIKAIGSNGLGIKIKGKIVDQTGTEISTFETSDLGMGGVYLIPEPNKTYTAKIDPNQSILLPKAEKTGYSIAFRAIDSTKFIATVKISNDLLNNGVLNLVAQKNGLPYMATKLATTARATEIVYENKDLPQGIVQFTLFSPNLTPVCERIVFVNNRANSIQVDLQQLKSNYSRKEKVELSLFSRLSSEPIPASFSVSVTNADAVAPDLAHESNILANLLLTSGLVGYVENPNSYFLNNDSKTSEALDYLMLTQGWRKIGWKLVEPVITHEVEKGLKIRGVITKNAMPLPLSTVSLVTNKDGIFKIDTVSNDKGEFTFENLEFSDSTKFIIQALTEANKKDVLVGIKHYPEQEVTAIPTNEVEVNVNESINNYLNKSRPYFEEQSRQGLLSKTTLLKEVNIESKRVNLAPNSKNLNGPGIADQVVDVSQLGLAKNVAEYLQGRVANVKIIGGTATNMRTYKAGFGTSLGGTSSGKDGKSGSMHVILDGMDMGSTESDEFDLRQLNPQEIESIEVLTSLSKLAVYGPNASRGLIIVTSKKGSSSTTNTTKYAPGVTTYFPKGYSVSREFYSPKYDVAPSDKPDLRTTVFWAPNLVTDEMGKVKFDYFNTEQPGNYRIVIEGIDVSGNLARKTYTYSVN
ncbi:MAG: TonB-dependent receptor plug domain-containing protein [Bacteroidota bacterium]